MPSAWAYLVARVSNSKILQTNQAELAEVEPETVAGLGVELKNPSRNWGGALIRLFSFPFPLAGGSGGHRSASTSNKAHTHTYIYYIYVYIYICVCLYIYHTPTYEDLKGVRKTTPEARPLVRLTGRPSDRPSFRQSVRHSVTAGGTTSAEAVAEKLGPCSNWVAGHIEIMSVQPFLDFPFALRAT